MDTNLLLKKNIFISHIILVSCLYLFFFICMPSLIQVYQKNGFGIFLVTTWGYVISRIIFGYPFLSFLGLSGLMYLDHWLLSKGFISNPEKPARYGLLVTIILGVTLFIFLLFSAAPIFGGFKVWQKSF